MVNLEIGGKPRIIIWYVSDDERYIDNAISILVQQLNGLEIIGMTAIEKISVNNLPFIPLNEISLNEGGMTSSLLPAQKISEYRKL